MRRLWMLVVLAPLTLALRAEPVPAEQDIQFKIVKQAAGDQKSRGTLYYLALGQEDSWEFLPGGFEMAIKAQAPGVWREVKGKKYFGTKKKQGETACTKKAVFDGLDWMVENATADDLVMLFIGCHGNCTKPGESIFHTDGGPIRPREVKAKLAKLPCQAIVINDACQSGNWPKEFDGDPMPPNVTALCCCLPTQNSGIEFDITLFEGLFGRADFNNDGIVDLDELIKYADLRIREVQGGKLNPVLHKSAQLKASKEVLPLTKVNKELISVVHQGREVYTAVVDKQDGDNYEVRVLGWGKPGSGLGASAMPSKFNRSNVILPKDGTALMVKKEGKGWLPACLVSKNGDSYNVRYVGADAGEATVAAENVRHLYAGNPSDDIPRGLFQRKN